ncbi:MAG: histidine kinase internal region [Eubacterium sp.]|jgi:sensor histidine kinase YesM|nr:histidine kinase internal region [Eubacterium sp.]
MLEFVKKQVYRKPFIVYTLSLLLVCTIVCTVLFQLILNSHLEQIKQETLKEFEDAQDSIGFNIQKIDSYFLSLYSEQNRPVLQDFMRFFGNDAETYMLKRIEEVSAEDTGNSFIEDIKNFVRSNQYSISRILFLTSKNSNVIYYETNGVAQVKFRIANQAAIVNNIAEGYNYTKKISQPGDMSVTLGEVSFLIRAQSIFENLNKNSIVHVAVMSKDGELFFNADEKLKGQFRQIYNSEKNSGKLGSGFFSEIHYNVYTSELYGYKMVSMVKNSDIIFQNQSMFLFVLFGILFIFVSITLLIAMRMSYDAKYLSLITRAIDKAKSGKFITIDIKSRKDEYGIIAGKLNDMSEQLDEHIQKEYILKLKQKEAEMKTLQQQINPHFLYNTLEVIRSHALVNNDESVAEVVFNLGGMLRDVVKNKDVITIDSELAMLTKYLKIMEFKFRGTFYYQIDVNQEIRAMETVKFWMQPLVENFFVHGFDRNCDYNLLLISGKIVDDQAVFEIINNGEKIEEARLETINSWLSSEAKENVDNTSIGLKNVYTRLSFFYGDGLKMKLSNNEEAGISISISISIKKEDANVSVADCR